MIRQFTITLSLAFVTTLLSAQSALDEYVALAIRQNLSIAEKKSLEEKQAFALQHAKKSFGPELRFLTSYTLAGGGRSIDLPVGFLLNDVYSTLNTLTGTQDFKPIENEEVTFLPDNFYDARFRLTQPILQPELRLNKKIKQEEVVLAGLQTNEVVRELVKEVKSAYLRWMQAGEAVSIIDQGLVLLNENRRITEGLIRNGLAIPSALLRIESEAEKVKAQKQRAEADLTNAASYFNFLLHRPADTEIIKDTFTGVPEVPLPHDLSAREELMQLQTGKRIRELALQREQKQHAPALGLQVEAGSQAYAPDWGGYYLGGIQLEIPIWDNKLSRLKQQEWKAEIEATEAKYEWTRKAFDVQLQTETENLRADIATYNSYLAILNSDQRFYHETLRRYKEGLSNYIELLDARTQITNTQLEQNLAKYQAWLRLTHIERINATAPISN